jgi:hypothetical protein
MMQDIRDALDPMPLAAPSNIHWPFLIACALAAAIAAAIALAAVRMVRRRVQHKPAPSPEQRALQRLKQANKADVRAYYFELTAILAEYLDAHFDLQFAQCTSAEMLRRLRDLGVMTEECSGALREFLEESDRVKFASLTEGADAGAAGRRCQRILYLVGGQIASTRQLAQPMESR